MIIVIGQGKKIECIQAIHLLQETLNDCQMQRLLEKLFQILQPTMNQYHNNKSQQLKLVNKITVDACTPQVNF